MLNEKIPLAGSTGYGPVQRFTPSFVIPNDATKVRLVPQQPVTAHRYYINDEEVTQFVWEEARIKAFETGQTQTAPYKLEPHLADIEHQPAPVVGNQAVPVTVYVLQDLRDKSKAGTTKYGTPLHTDNGREALVDAYQEVLDLAQYIKQRLLEEQTQKGLALPELDTDLQLQLERDTALMQLHQLRTSPKLLLQSLFKTIVNRIKSALK